MELLKIHHPACLMSPHVAINLLEFGQPICKGAFVIKYPN